MEKRHSTRTVEPGNITFGGTLCAANQYITMYISHYTMRAAPTITRNNFSANKQVCAGTSRLVVRQRVVVWCAPFDMSTPDPPDEIRAELSAQARQEGLIGLL